VTTIDIEPVKYTEPLEDCPAWCSEHRQEDIEDGGPGETFSQHRQVLHRHYWPAQRHSWPSGVRTLSVEQSAFDGRYFGPAAELTLWPDNKDETTQRLNVQDLRDLIAGAQRAIEIIESAQR
jgi:hypothetical protein